MSRQRQSQHGSPAEKSSNGRPAHSSDKDACVLLDTRRWWLPEALDSSAGPLPLLGEPNHKSLVTHWQGIAASLPAKPEAILVISGHWEEKVPTVYTHAAPPMLYDYYNFPPESYTIQYPAPGHPKLAARILSLLRGAGWETAEESKRGFDHGMFVPLKIIFPEADIPVVGLSMLSGYDPQKHIEVGKAIAPLRDEGVLIIGSGSSYHNFSGFKFGSSVANEGSLGFDNWMQETLVKGELTPEERMKAWANWEKAPHARDAHPQEDHLLPLHVALGAAEGGKAEAAFEDVAMGSKMSSFMWP